jgi:signal peptidase I
MTRPGSGDGPDDGHVPAPPAGRYASVAEWAAELNARSGRLGSPEVHGSGGSSNGPGEEPWSWEQLESEPGGAWAWRQIDREPDPYERPRHGTNGHTPAGRPGPLYDLPSAVNGYAPPTDPPRTDGYAPPAERARFNGHAPPGDRLRADDYGPVAGPPPAGRYPDRDSRLENPPPADRYPDRDDRVQNPPRVNGYAPPDDRRRRHGHLPAPGGHGRPESPPSVDGYARREDRRGADDYLPPAERRRPDARRVRDVPESAADALSGWDAIRYSPPARERPPRGGPDAADEERRPSTPPFADDGLHAPTRWGDIPAAVPPVGPRVVFPFARPDPPRLPRTTARPVPLPDRRAPRDLRQDPLAESTQLLRRFVPAQEVLDREDRELAPLRPPTLPQHPPRAVVRRRRVRRRLLEWPLLIVFALLSAYLIRAYVVQTFYIPSGSMHETLLEGDRVLVNKVSYHLHEVNRGDVVVFRRPPDFPVEDEDLIKRVIALPGETVQARDRQIYVDGRPLQEPYVQAACRGTEDFAPVRVPVGDLFVMGDNRCNSSDSRVFGPIAEDLVVGRAFVLAWPFQRLSWL